MRILQLISSGGLYGAESVILNIGRCSAGLGIHTVVGTFDNQHKPNSDFADAAQRLGLPVVVFPCRGRIDWRAVRQIRKAIRDQQIDLVHTHGYKADLYGYVAARSLGTALMATSHYWTRESAALRLYAFLDQQVLKRFDAVTVVSEAVADALCASGTARHRVQTIDNGIDGARFGGATATLRHELGIDDKLVIGAVGRLTPQKGFDHLARAAAEVVNEFSDAVFVVIGEGPERARLEQLTRDLGLSGRFILAGRRSDMAGAYASMDVFVLSSIDEGMPMVVLEAQAAARPVVATRVAAVPKLVTHEQTGILVQPGDAAALRAGIVRLLRDGELRGRLAESGRARVSEQFSAQAMARKYLDIYRRVLTERAVKPDVEFRRAET